MLPATTTTTPSLKHRPRVLLVDDEPSLLEVLNDVVASMDCDVTIAKNVAQAKRKLTAETFELLVTDVNLPDGDGLSLLTTLHRYQPTATAIVITGSPSVDGAINAIRCGAVDFVPKPFSHATLTRRIREALDQQIVLSRQDKRMIRLRDAVKKLGTARRTISQKVDLLCNDLIGAYGDLNKQMQSVRTEENFRKTVEQACDLEQLLCHTMDWLLRQLSHCNVALWLADDDGGFQLGAYMKHTIPGDELATAAMLNTILPATVRDGFLRTTGRDLKSKLKRDEFKLFDGQDILGITTTYLGEPLAAILFFRDESAAFTELDEAAIRAVAPIFATSLATVVRDPSLEDEREDEDRPAPRGDSSDWWKRGEAPPF